MIRGQKLVYSTFIALLISALVCTQSATVVVADARPDAAVEAAD
jgi:hypothetical protein